MKRPPKTRVTPIDPDVVAMADHVGARIRVLRALGNVSVTELASRISIHRNNLSLMQAGSPGMTLEWMVLIAKALGVPVTALFAGAPGTSDRADQSDHNALLLLNQIRGLTKKDQALIEELIGRLLRRPKIVVAGRASPAAPTED